MVRQKMIHWQYLVFITVLLSVNNHILLIDAENSQGTSGPYKWLRRDKFDNIMELMDTVSPENCHEKSKSMLLLPYHTLSQLPQYNTLPRDRIFANRSSLLHLHQAALTRGYFFSLVLQRLNASEDAHSLLPGLMYYYFSTSADVSANAGIINGSAVLMDFNMTYPNFYSNFFYNRSIPLFGPKASRLDDYDDETNWLREPTNSTILIKDYGAGPESNYTASWYKMNPYISERINFIPDRRKSISDKHQYSWHIRKAKTIGELEDTRSDDYSNFFGPPSPGQQETELPVKFTEPYYDCGKSNKWIVSAVAPIVDIMPRYARDKNLLRPRMVGIITMDIDFLRIDFNPCPAGVGNKDHMFAGTARCKPSTMCEPLPGFGFQRGGYQCHCQPGFRYPFYQNGPFQGSVIEQATEAEYRRNFDCIPVGWRQTLLTTDGIKEVNSLRRRRSVDEESRKKEEEEEGPFSRYNRLQFQLSLAESRKRMPYVAPMPDRPADSTALKWYHAQNYARDLGRKIISFIQQSYHGASHFAFGGISTKRHISRHNVSDLSSKTVPSQLRPRAPLTSSRNTSNEKPKQSRLLSRHKREVRYLGRSSEFDITKFNRIEDIVKKVSEGIVTEKNCHQMRPSELTFPGEVGYGAEKQFEGIGRTALRLSHFLSGFLQNRVDDAVFGDIRYDQPMNVYQLYGEVFSNVMGDLDVQSSGIFFDREMYVDQSGKRRQYFAPYAYREKSNEPGAIPTYEAVDYTGVKPLYLDEPWFKRLKERWASNTYGLERFTAKPWVRDNAAGKQKRKFDNFPLYYHAPRYEDGFWTQPYYDCKGFLKDWVITYATPFFGNSEHKTLTFMGVVTITVKLRKLDVNQCPSYFYTPNFFKSTARCHYQSTHCVHIPRRGFSLGGYKCDCRQGYEYHFSGISYFFDGQLVETEYRKKMLARENRYDILKCREAGVANLQPTIAVLICGLFLLFLNRSA